MIVEYLKDGKKMLTNKISYSTNISSNKTNFLSESSVVPDTLFELMKTNILIVEDNIYVSPCIITKGVDEHKET